MTRARSGTGLALRALLLGSAVGTPGAALAQSLRPGAPDAVRVLLDEAVWLRTQDQAAKAEQALDTALALDPGNADGLALKAEAAMEAGDAATARSLAARLRAARPEDPRLAALDRFVRGGALDRAALAEARRYAQAGQDEAAVAAYRRVFQGEPPPGLAVEYNQALGSTQASWGLARDALAERVRAAPQDVRAQEAYAELLTYRDDTRADGVARLRLLARSGDAAEQARWALRQVDALHPGATPGYGAEQGPAPKIVLALAADSTPATVTRDYEPYAQSGSLSLPPPDMLQPGPAPELSRPVADTAPRLYAGGPSGLDAAGGNPFRSGTAQTPDEPTPAPSKPVRDQMTADIDRDIRQVQSQVAPEVDVSLGVRGRSGAAGLGQLLAVEAPVEASFSPAGYGRLKVTVTPVGLVAGTPTGFNRELFGTNPLVASQVYKAGHQGAAGTALDVSYAYGPVTADIGSTPLGFLQTNVVGGVQFAPRLTNNLTLRLTAERRAVTDSLLSYGGQRDPNTGETFGGVVRNRGYAQLETQIGGASVYAGAGLSYLTGTRVRGNTEVEAGAGFTLPVWKTATQELSIGTNLVYLGFERNLSNYTVGNGGYFSPQHFFAALPNVSWTQHITPDLEYTLQGSLGLQTFRERSEAIFPGDSNLQSALETLAASNSTLPTRYNGVHDFGPSGGASGNIDYRVNNNLHIGAKAGFDRSGTFTEGTGLLYARYVFAPRN